MLTQALADFLVGPMHRENGGLFAQKYPKMAALRGFKIHPMCFTAQQNCCAVQHLHKATVGALQLLKFLSTAPPRARSERKCASTRQSNSCTAQLERLEMPWARLPNGAPFPLLTKMPQASRHFDLDLPPEVAHPADRPSQPGFRGSELILLISEPAHEGA